MLGFGLEYWSAAERFTWLWGLETYPLYSFDGGFGVDCFGALTLVTGPTWRLRSLHVGPWVTGGMFLFGTGLRLFHMEQQEPRRLGIEVRLGYLIENTWTLQLTARWSLWRH